MIFAIFFIDSWNSTLIFDCSLSRMFWSFNEICEDIIFIKNKKSMLTDVFSSNFNSKIPKSFSFLTIGMQMELILNVISLITGGNLYALEFITKS